MMKSKRILKWQNIVLVSLLALVMTSALVLSACDAVAPKGLSWEDGAYNNAYEPEYMNEDADYTIKPVSADSAASSGVIERKEIKNGTIDLLVTDVAETYKTLMKLVDGAGGYEFNKNEYRTGDVLSISLTVKIPPARLSWLETELNRNLPDGSIKRYEIKSEDITASYYDLASRLESARQSLARYEELLAEAKNVQDMLDIQREITSLQMTIESYEGRIRMWDKLVEYATLDISIRSVPVQAEKTWRFSTGSEVLDAMGNGFITVARYLWITILWIAVALVSASPILVPAAIIIVVIVLIRRRKKAIAQGLIQPREKKARTIQQTS